MQREEIESQGAEVQAERGSSLRIDYPALYGFGLQEWLLAFAVEEKKLGRPATAAEVAQSLARRRGAAARLAENWEGLRLASFEEAYALWEDGKNPYDRLRESRWAQLLTYQRAGIKEVRLCVSERSCPACRQHRGKTMTVDQALEHMPLPVKACKHWRERGVRFGWCRCMYMAVFD